MRFKQRSGGGKEGVVYQVKGRACGTERASVAGAQWAVEGEGDTGRKEPRELW